MSIYSDYAHGYLTKEHMYDDMHDEEDEEYDDEE